MTTLGVFLVLVSAVFYAGLSMQLYILRRKLDALAVAVDQVDERVVEQFTTLGSKVDDVHERSKHPHPLHGPVK